MIELRPPRAFWGATCALILVVGPASAQTQSPIKPSPAPGGTTKTLAISAPAYRAMLQKTLDELQTARPAALPKIVARLDTKMSVRRADGQVQGASGNLWSNLGRSLGTPKTITPTQLRQARQTLKIQIRALDEWTKTPVYRPVDASKIVAGLASSGQIRVAPLWWQKLISDTLSAISKAWQKFVKWFTGLFPAPTALQNTAAPSDKLLWALFYALVAAILAAVIWFLWRTFGGNLGRRNVKRVAQLENEDAALLQLPPDELLSRAERFAAQGNFREALRHRYLSLLLDLDARGVWRYDARRTNWEHIAALNRTDKNRELVAPLSDLTKRFDRVRYGGANCDDESWRRFDGDSRNFENRAAPGQKSVAREKTEALEAGAMR